MLVFSPFFPFFFCVPLLGFPLGNCHLIFILISCSFSFHLPCCGRVCVCVYHLNRCKTSLICRGHGSCFPSHANEAMGFSRKGTWTHAPVPAIYIYIYRVPPLGAYKSQLGGTYILSLLVYTFIVSCDPIYIYMYCLISSCLVFGVCCTTGTFHIRIREDVSIQVCFSCRRRQDDMSPTREP